jgi:hypothetical protein
MTVNEIQDQGLNRLLPSLRLRRGLIFGIIIVTALLAFELFNYSTTDFALSDLLGDLEFLSIRWATILSIAFCGIDFAGIARLFTPEEGRQEPSEVWYLFGAWLMAATMNAMLTWWGVSLAVMKHTSLGNEVVARETLLKVVPVFVAIMVWLIRVLIIGTFSVAGERMFSQSDTRAPARPRQVNYSAPLNAPLPIQNGVSSRALGSRSLAPAPAPRTMAPPAHRPAPKPANIPETIPVRPEPTYHPVTMSSTQPAPNTASPMPSRSFSARPTTPPKPN